MEHLDNSMLDLLSEFANAGIVYYERGAPYFYPTRLCTTLNAGGLNSIQQEDQQGFLVVETNYRIYAYTCTFLCSLYLPGRVWLSVEM